MNLDLNFMFGILDRSVTLLIFRHLHGMLFDDDPDEISILMYHSISDAFDGSKNGYYGTNTSIGVFQEQMKYLSENRFRVVDIAAAMDPSKEERADRGRKVVITFDDGFRDFYQNAFPVLEKYGFPAAMFLPTGYIGDRPKTFLGRQCLTWAEVRELAGRSITFGSHTVSHRQLRNCTSKEIDHEMRRSKEEIESHTGEKVVFFSYPFAFPEENPRFVSRLQDLLMRAGYQNGITTVIGTNAKTKSSFWLKRLPINTRDDRMLFESKIHGAYNWVHFPQCAYKHMKKILRRKMSRENP